MGLWDGIVKPLLGWRHLPDSSPALAPTDPILSRLLLYVVEVQNETRRRVTDCKQRISGRLMQIT